MAVNSIKLCALICSALLAQSAVGKDGKSTPSLNAPSSMEKLDNVTKLQPGRAIGIQILEDKRVGLQQVIAVTGEIQAPYLGLTKAAGMTCRELAYKLKTELEKSFFKQATLVVTLGRDMTHGRIVCPDLEFVVAFGAVAKQGKWDLPSDSDLTVLGLLHRAGSLEPKKKISAIRIIRETPQGHKRILVNTKGILVEKNYEYDLFLRNHDVVFFE